MADKREDGIKKAGELYCEIQELDKKRRVAWETVSDLRKRLKEAEVEDEALDKKRDHLEDQVSDLFDVEIERREAEGEKLGDS